MKQHGVTIIREINQSLPDDYVAKILEANKTGCSHTGISDNGVRIVSQRKMEVYSLEDAKKWMNHENLLKRRVVFFFTNSPNIRSLDDVQPYTVLRNDKDQAIIVAFLNGDFSQFTQENSTKSNEQLCVEKKIIPLIAKAFKLGDQDLKKTFDELADDDNALAFGNLMVGDTGSIILMGANGGLQCFSVGGETITKDVPGCYWTTDALEEPLEVPAAAPQQDEFSDEPQPQIVAPKPTVVPAAAVKQPSKIVASTKPHIASVVPVTKSSDRPAADTTSARVDLKDENTILALLIPKDMDNKRKGTWLSKRIPGGFDLTPIMTGKETHLRLKRSQANAKFLQDYLNQEKLGGLDALGTSTLIPKSATQPKVVPAHGQTEYPDGKPDSQPAVVEPGKETKPGDVKHGVTDEPLPIFSPQQVEATLKFKQGVDKKGHPIASPEDMEKKIGTFYKMFGDSFKISDLERWQLGDMEEYSQHAPAMMAKLMYWTVHELRTVSAMLDSVTDPHFKKQAQPAQAQAQPVHSAPKSKIIPARRSA